MNSNGSENFEEDITQPPSSDPQQDLINDTDDQPDKEPLGNVGEATTSEKNRQIGPYRILEPLGEGGMGTVYLAEQREPVKRRVALKIIRAGMDTGQIIARFEAERQALAMMDHTNIAKVLDGGETPTGQPYFVMELVKGQPITKFCDNHKLSIPERLELFSDVCSAVQHAHQKGIIHRDLKPSNILVTLKDDKPVAKVIDFGLAKATNQRLTEKTMFTAHGQVMGTPEYMSPEQAQLNDLDVDTRSDIYSLGIILYELLTGSTPLKRESLLNAGMLEILARIWEEEPERPSSRISESEESLESISSLRQIEPRRFSSVMKGDLDWIVLKAMEKDRSRRYETANGFAADIARYLNDEPIVARPPSAGYRFQKLIRKNRAVVIFASTVAALLLVGIGVSVSLAMWAFNEAELAKIAEVTATEERAKTEAALEIAESRRIAAEESEKRATAVLEVVTDAFESTNLYDGAHYDMPASDVLKRAYAELDTKLANDPKGRVTLLNAIANSFHHAGKYQAAYEAAEASAKLANDVFGPFAPETLRAENQLMRSKTTLYTNVEAFDFIKSILGKRETQLGQHHNETLRANFYLGVAHGRAGNFQKAIDIFEKLVAVNDSQNGSEHEFTIHAMHMLGHYLYKNNEVAKAIEIQRTVCKRFRKVFGETNPQTLSSDLNLAESLYASGQTAKALELGERTLSIRREIIGNEHPLTIRTVGGLALRYAETGQKSKAIKHYETHYELSKKIHGNESPETIRTMTALAKLYQSTGQSEKTLELQRQIKNLQFVSLEANSLDVIPQIGALTRAVVEINPSLATDFTESYLSIARQTPSESTKDGDRITLIQLGHDMAFLSEALLKFQAFKDCEKVAEVCLGYREATEPNQWWTQMTRHVLAASLLAQEGKEKQAETILNSMVDLDEVKNPSALAGNLSTLIDSLITDGQSVICEPMARCVVDGYRRDYPKSAAFSYAQCALAHILSQSEKRDEATSLFEEGYPNLIARRHGFRTHKIRYRKLINATGWQIQHNERVGINDKTHQLSVDLVHYERQHRRQVVLEQFKNLDSSKPEFAERIRELENTYVTNEKPSTTEWRSNHLDAAWIAGFAIHRLEHQPQEFAAALKRVRQYLVELKNDADIDASDELNWVEAIQHLEMLERLDEEGTWNQQDSLNRVANLLPRCTDNGRRTVCSFINNKAWKYSTSMSADDRNGELAVELGMIATKQCDDNSKPAYLDTLAAAYAEVGDWAQAKKTIEKAIELASDQKQKDSFMENLKAIKSQTAIRADDE